MRAPVRVPDVCDRGRVGVRLDRGACGAGVRLDEPIARSLGHRAFLADAAPDETRHSQHERPSDEPVVCHERP